ncbi:MAG: hypothetical protein ACRDY4_00675 [Acidimicrobiia bacterium]
MTAGALDLRLLPAHVEEVAHGDGLDILVRLGPVLAVAVVLVWAALTQLPRQRGRGMTQAGAAAGFGLAGVLHLMLVPSHARESVVAGVFFATAGVAEVAVAWFMATHPVSRISVAVGLVVVAALLAVYVISRWWGLPFGLGGEAVDALGVMSKLLEAGAAVLAVGAAAGWRTKRPTPNEALAGLVGATALLARPLFDLGPRPAGVAAALAGAIGMQLIGGRRHRDWSAAVIDGALVALLLRGDAPWWALLAGGAVASALRRAQHGWGGALVPPAPLAVLVVLWAVPRARFEILHVSHPDETLAAVASFGIAVSMATAAWRTGRLPVLVAFLGAHLAVQGLRLAADRTSIEAVEVPGFSLGLFLLAAVAVTGPTDAGRGLAVAGAVLAGVADAFLRDLGVAYAPLVGVVTAGLVVAAVRLAGTNRRPVALGGAASPRAGRDGGSGP